MIGSKDMIFLHNESSAGSTKVCDVSAADSKSPRCSSSQNNRKTSEGKTVRPVVVNVLPFYEKDKCQ
jgi:hypothetical protein